MKNDFFSYLEMCISEQKLAHAFLLETDDINQTTALIVDYLYEKGLIKTRDLFNNLNLVIIEPEGKEIKAGSIELLQSRYATKPINDQYNIYLIKRAEKMNLSAANKLLKFLEEPADYIISFLLVNSDSGMLSTIKSRCQSFRLNYQTGDPSLDNNVENLLDININSAYETKLDLKKTLMTLERADLITIIQKSIIVLDQRLSENIEALDRATSNIILLDKILHLLESNVNIELVLDKLCMELR